MQGTPITISGTSTLEKLYNFPKVCKGKHSFVEARVSYALLVDDELNSIPFPMFGKVCRKCGELDR